MKAVTNLWAYLTDRWPMLVKLAKLVITQQQKTPEPRIISADIFISSVPFARPNAGLSRG